MSATTEPARQVLERTRQKEQAPRHVVEAEIGQDGRAKVRAIGKSMERAPS